MLTSIETILVSSPKKNYFSSQTPSVMVLGDTPSERAKWVGGSPQPGGSQNRRARAAQEEARKRGRHPLHLRIIQGFS
jgi:hypothetical protein